MTEEFPPDALRIIEEPRACAYLPEQAAALEYRLIPHLSPEQLEHLLERGWRRFGVQLFRPACPECRQCIPIRVCVSEFSLSKSQRRTLRRNSHVRFEIHPPDVTPTHIDLYNRWHEDMTARSGWPLQQTDLQEYKQGFLMGHFASLHEIRYLAGDELIGVGLVDVLPNSLSSAYFYHDPAWRPLSPGTFSLLCEINLARQFSRDYLYLGYWIPGCSSMEYKNRFQPAETLSSFPDETSVPIWGAYSE